MTHTARLVSMTAYHAGRFVGRVLRSAMTWRRMITDTIEHIRYMRDTAKLYSLRSRVTRDPATQDAYAVYANRYQRRWGHLAMKRYEDLRRGR